MTKITKVQPETSRDSKKHKHGISKKHHASRRRISSGSKRDYKKSVSNSLVYRSLKFDKDSYVGFKVTYSGKGRLGNYDRTKVSVILIPDSSSSRGYRPIAGALARATKGEVLVCAYSSRGGYNEKLISMIVSRMKFAKSKIRSVSLISENRDVLAVFKEKLLQVDRLVESLDGNDQTAPISTPDNLDDSFQDAPTSPQAVPSHVALHVGKRMTDRKRKVQLITMTRKGQPVADGPAGGVITRIVKSIFGRLGGIFKSNGGSPTESTSSSVFSIRESAYRVSDKLAFSNVNHCDLIASGMLAIE